MRFVWILAALALACSPVKDLNRVASNYSDKSIFNGEWLHRGVIVDKTFGHAATFIGSASELEPVRFKITENYLEAYRSYEKVPGSEGANPGRQTLVAKFPILSHFDIKRQYNEQNGIENNVIEENTKDRPWHERRYVRVDWSTNLVDDAQFNSDLRMQSLTALPRNTFDKEPFHARVTDTYIETTIDAMMQMDENICAYIGDWNCDPSRVRVKYAFMKRTEPSQYEKMSYPDYLTVEVGQNSKKELCLKKLDGSNEDCKNLQELWLYRTSTGAEICDLSRGHNPENCEPFQVPMFARFGYFRTERHHFDREQGFTLSGREQLINRWNLWAASKNDKGARIPLSEREPKAIVYYLNAGFPMELYETSQQLADDWNGAFVGAVASVKGISKDEVSARFGKLFQIRLNDCNLHNLSNYVEEKHLEGDLARRGLLPIQSGNLEQGCALVQALSYERSLEPRFDWQELGDLRYSFVNYTTKAELSGPLGFGPSSTDPRTGEIISAAANIYGAALDTYAAFGADVVQLLKGDITTKSLMDGAQIRAQIQAKRAARNLEAPQSEIDAFSRLIDERIARIPEGEYRKAVPLSSVTSKLRALNESGFEDQYLMSEEMPHLFASSYNYDKARPSSWTQPLLPPFETFFGNQEAEVLRAKGVQDRNTSFIQAFEQREDFFGKRSACFMADVIEPAVAELARSLTNKSWEEAYQFIRAQIFRAVTAHELGHTFGLRHNFEGSADALNFFPGFWGVDTKDERMGASNRKSELKYSSIMDYHQRFNSDFGGIGLYDRAAIKFGYTGLIEVFDEARSEFVPRGWSTNIDMFHYKDLPYLYSGGNVDDALDKHYEDVRTRFVSGDESARINVASLGLKAKPENLYRRRDISFADYYSAVGSRLFGLQSDAGDVYEVPYKFCSDAFAFGGNISCNRWDMGASAEEIVDNAAELYESYYLFNAYRGDKLQINPSSYMARLYTRTYQPMLNAYRYLYFYRKSNLRMWPLMQDWTTAAYKGLNFFGRVLQTPEPGRYCLADEKLYVPIEEDKPCADPIEIGDLDGREYNTSWSDEFFSKPNHIGYFYDKVLALHALTDSTTFMQRDLSNAFSRNALSIGYYRVFAPEMIDLFSAIFQDDAYRYAPSVNVGNGVATISYRPLVGLVPDAKQSSLRIKPSQSWALRYYALALPMIHYSSTVDGQLDFSKRARITIAGSKNDPVIDQGLGQQLFTDPFTKISYRSALVESEALSPGYLLLKDAQKSLLQWKGARDGVERAKSQGADAMSSAKAELSNAEHQLKDKIHLVELMNYLGDLLEP